MSARRWVRAVRIFLGWAVGGAVLAILLGGATAAASPAVRAAVGGTALTGGDCAPVGLPIHHPRPASPAVKTEPALTSARPVARVGVYYFDGWANRCSFHFNGLLSPSYVGREPLSGWHDGTPAAMEAQLAWAHGDGVSFFIFDWYYHVLPRTLRWSRQQRQRRPARLPCPAAS